MTQRLYQICYKVIISSRYSLHCTFIQKKRAIKVNFELLTIRQLDLGIWLKKMCLIMITLDLTKGYRDIGIHIVELFEKVYLRYN